MKKVGASKLASNGLWWGSKKKWEITCGECGFVWIEKVPIREPSQAICPACKTVNFWSTHQWAQAYEAMLEEER